jgi:hypothetical protein
MTFMAWPDIEAFHNVRKYIRVDPTEWWKTKELLAGTSTVTYRAKVKLHGTNAAVQVHTDGSIVCQSRESIITPEKDNAGFARWVMGNKEIWHEAMGFIIYGEWCGPGIQKGVAVAQAPKKFFAVFAARPLDGSDTLIISPGELMDLVRCIPDTYVLPWHTHQVAPHSDTHVFTKLDVDWKLTDEELSGVIAPVNDWVMAIEANDPWVEGTFGVKGTGEGLVFYPYSTPHLGFENFNNLCFKAKGEKHKNIATAKPVQVSAESAASIDAFVDMVLTTARLEQGVTKVSPDGALTFDMKQTGKFVSWVLGDVEKEAQDELSASNLTWAQVQKPITDKARSWYLTKAKQ